MARLSQTTKDNVANKFFGIEVECFVPSSDWYAQGQPTPQWSSSTGHSLYSSPEARVPGLPVGHGWTVKTDSSISTSRSGGWMGIEVVSPKLKGKDGINQVIKVLKWLNDLGAVVNPSCGLHVTVTCKRDEGTIKRLVQLARRYETALYASCGSAQRYDKYYSRRIVGGSRHGGGDCYGQIARTGNARLQDCRYRWLNLQHAAAGNERVEFRCFAGTTNVDKILGHIVSTLTLAARAEDENLGEQKLTSQDGVKSVNRLVRWTDWSLLTSAQAAASKRELKRLAAKYVANGGQTSSRQSIRQAA